MTPCRQNLCLADPSITLFLAGLAVTVLIIAAGFLVERSIRRHDSVRLTRARARQERRAARWRRAGGNS